MLGPAGVVHVAAVRRKLKHAAAVHAAVGAVFVMEIIVLSEPTIERSKLLGYMCTGAAISAAWWHRLTPVLNFISLGVSKTTREYLKETFKSGILAGAQALSAANAGAVSLPAHQMLHLSCHGTIMLTVFAPLLLKPLIDFMS